jgi:putative oxidoreductase
VTQQIFTPRQHADRPLVSFALLALRLGAGGLLLGGHGWAKLMSFGQRAASFADPIGLGPTVSFALVVGAEVFCSALVMVGLGTRFATIPILIFLSVAAFVQHGGDPWSKRELPFLYMVSFLAILIAGGGRYAVDATITRAFGKWPRG